MYCELVMAECDETANSIYHKDELRSKKEDRRTRQYRDQSNRKGVARKCLGF